MPFNVCAAQKFVERFGRTDDSLCMLGEQIEEAIFPRHEFSKPVQHLRSIDCHKAVIEHAVGREKPLATDVMGLPPDHASHQRLPQRLSSIGHSFRATVFTIAERVGVIKCSYEHSIFAK
ncbi:hypothetical protein [Rhizobium leguminosarum]|uniref:hypothetical protein n=1 Tax=Rhizobium leguminosarum TaxID=384 RepID=UPI0021B0C951|nr:hypothetical protein [Rhizobium leguminosarum]